ncbi:MAG: hypothetical protein HC851_22270, partial [Acaryochloris sp. RU_4_1]|nr:hypothetical protein [Acaryochloris sp. RU_4_1]
MTVRTETVSCGMRMWGGWRSWAAVAGALVSGELVVDAPEDLRLGAVGADQLATIELVGSTVKLKYHLLDRLVVELRDQYVTGTVVVKLVG